MKSNKKVNNKTFKKATGFFKLFLIVDGYINYLNKNTLFVGMVMFVMNIASRFVTIKLSKSMESYMKFTFSKNILVFTIAFIGTRDLYAALVITFLFWIFMDFLFNEESPYCCVPDKYRILAKLVDQNNDGIITEDEINHAISVLEKAKKEKQKMNQRKNFTLFGNYLSDSYKSYN